jgi:hypothetical protein
VLTALGELVGVTKCGVDVGLPVGMLTAGVCGGLPGFWLVVKLGLCVVTLGLCVVTGCLVGVTKP